MMEEPEMKLTLHIDHSPTTTLRARIFGHSDAIIPFREGIIAKKCKILQELTFYLNYIGWMHDILPCDLVPAIEGMVDSHGTDITLDKPEVKLSMTKHLSMPSLATNTPYIMLRDIAQGFEKPAVLDIKLGSRTWALGAAPDKVTRMRGKCQHATTGKLQFRVRAAMWYSKNQAKWPIDENANFVTREFGNKCSEQELLEFLSDFFHYSEQIPFYVNRLRDLRLALMRLRSERNARFFSSSVLLVYDEANPEFKECRILDFAKCYFDINEAAAKFNESVEDCEDDIIPGLTNLIHMLKLIGADEPELVIGSPEIPPMLYEMDPSEFV